MYSEPSQRSKIGRFEKIIIVFNYFYKKLNVSGFKYVRALNIRKSSYKYDRVLNVRQDVIMEGF